MCSSLSSHISGGFIRLPPQRQEAEREFPFYEYLIHNKVFNFILFNPRGRKMWRSRPPQGQKSESRCYSVSRRMKAYKFFGSRILSVDGIAGKRRTFAGPRASPRLLLIVSPTFFLLPVVIRLAAFPLDHSRGIRTAHGDLAELCVRHPAGSAPESTWD